VAVFKGLRVIWLGVAAVAGCGGGGDGGPTGTTAVVAGTVTFDLVPSVAGLGLDYAATAPAPARGVTVEIVAGAEVLATTTTDAAGAYSISVPRDRSAVVRVKAEMLSAAGPSWDFRVVDNTNGEALYVLEGDTFNTGSARSTQNLHAASGWSGSAYSDARSAAPFAILDVVYDAAQFVLAVEPELAFPPLVLHWSPDNVPSLDGDGRRDLASGEISTSFFAPALGIYLLGAENSDSDEYDRHVIAHEWGHYFEHSFSRSDSIGGPHSLYDQLDLRVAFGEGWGNAFSAMVTGQSVYRDASGPQQSKGASFDIEGASFLSGPNPNPGWYSEWSVHELIFDLYDGDQDTLQDGLELGFAPIYSVLTGRQRSAAPLTSIFTFIAALKEEQVADAPVIDSLVEAQQIAAVADGYGSGETNAGRPDSDDVLPIYADLVINGGPVVVCSTDEFTSDITGSINKLGSRAYLRFSAVAAAATITVTATVVPPGEAGDPDFVLHQRGSIAVSEEPPGDSCTATTPLQCSETLTLMLAGGDHVLEVYEWTNTEPADSDTPPIGRTCFDVEVIQ
jgi:hypothetical protein